MFWWFCGDHSNMNIFCNNGNAKAHDDDDDKVRRSKYNKKMSTIPEEDDDRFSSIFTYNTMAQYSANRYGAFGLLYTNKNKRLQLVLLMKP
jgi:hypothetical protein